MILAVFDHDESRIRYVLAAIRSENITPGGFIYPKSWFEGLAARLRKDEAAERNAFTNARTEVEKTVAADPGNERNLLLLAMIDAALGHRDEAISEAQRGCAMTPQDSERNVGPANRCCLAVVYAWTDQPDLALQELDKLVSGPAGANMPYQVTFGDFQLNPVWDPLRADPRFREADRTSGPRHDALTAKNEGFARSLSAGGQSDLEKFFEIGDAEAVRTPMSALVTARDSDLTTTPTHPMNVSTLSPVATPIPLCWKPIRWFLDALF